MFFPLFQSGLWSSKNVVLSSWVVKFIVSFLCRFHCSKSFCVLTVTRFFVPCCLMQLSEVTVQRFPFFSFTSFVYSLTKGVPVRIHQRRSPPLELNMFRINKGSPRTHFLSSQGQPADSFSDAPGKSLNCGFFTWIDLVPRRKPPTSTAMRLSTSMKLLSPFTMPTRLLSCKPVTMLF